MDEIYCWEVCYNLIATCRSPELFSTTNFEGYTKGAFEGTVSCNFCFLVTQNYLLKYCFICNNKIWILNHIINTWKYYIFWYYFLSFFHMNSFTVVTIWYILHFTINSHTSLCCHIVLYESMKTELKITFGKLCYIKIIYCFSYSTILHCKSF